MVPISVNFVDLRSVAASNQQDLWERIVQQPTSFCRRMAKIQLLSDELLIAIYSYLRATELSTGLQVDKTVFSKRNVSTASKHLSMLFTYTTTGSIKSNLKLNIQFLPPSDLRVKEISCIKAAISSPQPDNNLGNTLDTDCFGVYNHFVRLLD